MNNILVKFFMLIIITHFMSCNVYGLHFYRKLCAPDKQAAILISSAILQGQNKYFKADKYDINVLEKKENFEVVYKVKCPPKHMCKGGVKKLVISKKNCMVIDIEEQR